MADTYRQYQEARDTAWRALLHVRDKRLPIDAEGLARDVGLYVAPLPDVREQPKLAALIQKAGKGNGVSLRIRGEWHLFLAPMTEDRRRFFVAHELGHLLLAHETRVLSPGVRCFADAGNAGDLMEEPESPLDYAADIFAIRLLAPACLLHEMHVDTASGIMRLCGLPPRAAALRAERMALLNERDAFFTHPLERQVREAYLPFLRERGAAPAPAQAAERALPLVMPLPQTENEESEKEERGKGAENTEKKPAKPIRLWLFAAAGFALAALAFFILRR